MYDARSPVRPPHCTPPHPVVMAAGWGWGLGVDSACALFLTALSFSELHHQTSLPTGFSQTHIGSHSGDPGPQYMEELGNGNSLGIIPLCAVM